MFLGTKRFSQKLYSDIGHNFYKKRCKVNDFICNFACDFKK